MRFQSNGLTHGIKSTPYRMPWLTPRENTMADAFALAGRELVLKALLGTYSDI